jgi:hypothetical protein
VSKGKRTVPTWLDSALIDALHVEALRMDRSISWCVQFCVKHAIAEIRKMEAAPK